MTAVDNFASKSRLSKYRNIRVSIKKNIPLLYKDEKRRIKGEKIAKMQLDRTIELYTQQLFLFLPVGWTEIFQFFHKIISNDNLLYILQACTLRPFK